MDHASKGRNGSLFGFCRVRIGALDGEAEDTCVLSIDISDWNVFDFELSELCFVEFTDGAVAEKIDRSWDGFGDLDVDVIFEAHSSGVC